MQLLGERWQSKVVSIQLQNKLQQQTTVSSSAEWQGDFSASPTMKISLVTELGELHSTGCYIVANRRKYSTIRMPPSNTPAAAHRTTLDACDGKAHSVTEWQTPKNRNAMSTWNPLTTGVGHPSYRV